MSHPKMQVVLEGRAGRSVEGSFAALPAGKIPIGTC
jgi:hypothetical protein